MYLGKQILNNLYYFVLIAFYDDKYSRLSI